MVRLAVIALLVVPAVAPAQGFSVPYRTGTNPYRTPGGFLGGFNPVFRVPRPVPYRGVGWLSPGGVYDPGFFTTFGPNVYYIPSIAGELPQQVVPTPPPLLGAGVPAPLPTAAVPAAGPRPAELRLELPAPAELWVNGVKQTGSDAVRTLTSPPLPAGGSHTFDLKATWTAADGKYEWDRTVTVAAGANSKVVVAAGFKVPN